MFRKINNRFAGMRTPEAARVVDEYGRMLGRRATRFMENARLNSRFKWGIFILLSLAIAFAAFKVSKSNSQEIEDDYN